ncbi:MAG: hypothetical protein EB127_00120 [Alphaproteobacteria bacterium]|nr:hypothetical protein [Alphaproteobacteria bacterium]
MADFTTRAFNSFSGADIKAVFANQEVGNLMAVSYAIQREKAPIYVLGEANPRAFSRGKRGIAGSLIFIQFDTHAILEQFNVDDPSSDLGKFAKKKYEISPEQLHGNAPLDVTTLQQTAADNPGSMAEIAKAFYADQIPAFDITVAAANEYGAVARCVIHGVELMNEGWGMGIEDRQADMQTTYLARAVSRWTVKSPTGAVLSKVGTLERAGGGVILKGAIGSSAG